MKVIRRTEMELEINELKNAQIGDILNVDLRSGITAEFAVIGKDADEVNTITIQQITACKRLPFNKNGSNQYEDSDIQKYCTGEWMEDLPEGLRSRVVGDPFLLSKEEVETGEKYPFYKDSRNWIKTDDEGDISWWWTRSAYRGNGCYAWYIYPSGFVCYGSAANYSFEAAPACAISVI